MISEDNTIGLVEMVRAESVDIPYLARECIDSGRKILEVAGRNYCGLGEHCPLQGENKLGALFECLRDRYYAELAEKKHALDKA